MLNKQPVISQIPDVTTSANRESDIVSFTVSDEETPAGKLIVAAVNSSNPTLAPVGNVLFGGSGGSRLLFVIPSQDQFGTSAITIRVTNADQGWSERTFDFTVLPAPTPVITADHPAGPIHRKNSTDPCVSTSADRRSVVIGKNQPTPFIPLTVEHIDPGSVTITGETSDPTLIPDRNIFFGGSGKSRSIFIIPATDRIGEGRITIRVRDPRGRKASTSLQVTVCETAEPEQRIPELKVEMRGLIPTVLISYAREDEDMARTLYSKLAEDGLNPWMDKVDIYAGEDWDRSIRTAIRKSDFVIVCVSHKIRNKRGYIQKEIRLVLDRVSEIPPGDIFLIPLRIEVCDVPEELQRYQYVDWFLDDGYDRLLGSIRKESQKKEVVKDSST